MTTTLRPPVVQTGPGAGMQPTPGRERVVARPFISLLGAICVLAGASALITTVAGTGWMGPAIQVVALVWLIGVGCRLLRFHSAVTVLAQTSGVLVTLTAVFTTGGYGGFIPNAQVVREADALFTGAWDQILHATVPAPGTPELGFLIAITLGLIALVVDFFVAEVDAPALVALPMLCLYSVPASIAEQLLPWWAFAVPAACYAALVAIAGHPGRRVGLRAGVAVALSGAVAVVLAIGASLLIADSITDIGTAGRVPRTNPANGSSDIGLSPFALLRGDLQARDAIDLLQISNLPQPDYLRTTALETWDPNLGFSLREPEDGSVPAADGITINPLTNDPAAQTTQIGVHVLNFSDRFVPIYQGTQVVSGLGGGYSYNPGLGAIFKSRPVSPSDYTMTVGYGVISPDLLRTDTVTGGGVLTDSEGVPSGAITVAQSITAAGTNAFDKARLLQEYFTNGQNGFRYSLTVPGGNTGSLLTDFLQNKQGYCEQYASAMAIMLRSIGIPTRVAIGFTQGTKTAEGSFRITSHDAHAWVEVRFDTAGWVRFDPTPLSESVGGQQGFATSADGSPSSSAADTGTSGATTAGTAGSSERAGSTATLTDFETVVVPGGNSGASTGFWKPAYSWVLAGLILLSGLTAVPSWWRRRTSRRRLQIAAAGGSGAAAAAWAEVEDLAADHGLASQSGITVRKAANQLAREGKLTEGSRAGLRRIALATESAWYSPAGYVPVGEVDLAEDVRRISADLEHAEPLTVATRLLPRSLRVPVR